MTYMVCLQIVKCKNTINYQLYVISNVFFNQLLKNLRDFLFFWGKRCRQSLHCTLQNAVLWNFARFILQAVNQEFKKTVFHIWNN